MKRHLFIGIVFLVLVVLAACTSTTKVSEPADGPSPELTAIDSLMWRQPDSALACLLPYFDTCGDVSGNVSTATEYNRHYANLLLAELLYKNDYAQSNREELLQAVAYFDSLLLMADRVDTRGVSPQGSGRRDAPRASANNNASSLAFLDARAHYINGVGHYEQNDMVPACKEYMKALEVMESHFKEKELVGKKARLMALTYTHLTSLFSDLYLHEQAIYFAKGSLPYYMKHESPSWNASWVLARIGGHFEMMNELDSAEYYYHKAMTALNDTNTLMYRDIVTKQVCIKYTKDPSQADETIHQLRNLLLKSENDKEYLARLAFIGEIYFYEKQYDSAWHSLSMVYCETSSIASKKQAAEWLVEICKAQGKVSEMHEYAEFLVPFANQEENKSEIKSQLAQLFNTFGQTKSDRQHQMKAEKHAKQVITVIVSLLFVMLVLYVRNKRHKQKLETQIETERHAHMMQQAALAGRLRQSNAALKEQSKLTSSITPSLSEQDRNGAESYADEPICQQILAVCNDKNNSFKSTVPVSAYASIALTNAQKAQLKEAATRHYGPLFEKLKLQYPELRGKDFLYCQLCLLGLDNMQIAVLTQLSYRTIWEREKRLQTLFHADDRIAIILHEMMMH